MKISDLQLDTLKEFVLIGVGKSAAILNDLLETHVSLEVPNISILSYSELVSKMDQYDSTFLATIAVRFKGDIAGSSSLIFGNINDANKIVSILTGEEIGTPELDGVKTSTLVEVGNIVLNGILGSISNLLNFHLVYSIPVWEEKEAIHLNDNVTTDSIILIAETNFTIRKHDISGEILLMFEVQSFRTLIDALDLYIEKSYEQS